MGPRTKGGTSFTKQHFLRDSHLETCTQQWHMGQIVYTYGHNNSLLCFSLVPSHTDSGWSPMSCFEWCTVSKQLRCGTCSLLLIFEALRLPCEEAQASLLEDERPHGEEGSHPSWRALDQPVCQPPVMGVRPSHQLTMAQESARQRSAEPLQKEVPADYRLMS